MPELVFVPQVLLGLWLKNVWAHPSININDILWFEWWDDQADIKIQFEEVPSHINAGTMDRRTEIFNALVNIHVFVRDLNKNANLPLIQNNLDNVDFTTEFGESDRIGLIIPYIAELINDNPCGLDFPVLEMECRDAYEARMGPIEDVVSHWIIPVNIRYYQS